MGKFFPPDIIDFFGSSSIKEGKATFVPCTNGETLERIQEALMGDGCTDESISKARRAMRWIIAQHESETDTSNPDIVEEEDALPGEAEARPFLKRLFGL